MAIKRKHTEKKASFFITFTCVKWKHLIFDSYSYNAFYKWFSYLKTIDVKVLSYVIMPNHFHGVFHIPEDCPKTINQMVSNGKRFIAYDIVKNFEQQKNEKILQFLFENTPENEKRKGTKHKIFKTSFDCKLMYDEKVLDTKIDYIHKNPCMGKWNLVSDYTLYEFSSAGFYKIGIENEFITHYKDL